MELQIDRNAVARCRKSAAAIADPVQTFIGRHSTVSVERSILRLLGVDGVDASGVPVPNAIVDALAPRERNDGVAVPFGRALASSGLEPSDLGAQLASGALDASRFANVSREDARAAVALHARNALERIRARRDERTELLAQFPQLPPPLLYMIVATGNIY